MIQEAKVKDKFEIVFAIEGDAKPHAINVAADATAASVLALIIAEHGIRENVALYWEDDDAPLEPASRPVARLQEDFRQLHVSRNGKITVTIAYNGKTKSHKFRPGSTIRNVIKWAISEDGFGLVGKPVEFQIKFNGKVIPPATHVGQLARADCEIAVDLVANVKPQG